MFVHIKTTDDEEREEMYEIDGSDIVTITKVFNGVRFITEDGEELSVVMRDSGFEFVYIGDDPDIEHWYSCNNGFVRRLSVRKGASESGKVDNLVPFPEK